VSKEFIEEIGDIVEIAGIIDEVIDIRLLCDKYGCKNSCKN